MTYACIRCSSPFDVNPAFYDAIDIPLPVECVVCRLIARQADAKLWGGSANRARDGSAASVTRKPVRRPPGHRWTSAQILDVLHTWIQAHAQRFPKSLEFDADPDLPAAHTIRRHFINFAICAAAVRTAYPDMRMIETPIHTAETILDAIQVWMVAHPGLVPLAADFKRDATLPGLGIVHRRIGPLVRVYLLLERRGVPCLAQYQHTIVSMYRANGLKGAKANIRNQRKRMA